MCSPVACRTCGKTTWAGCGMHVDDVMRNVPKAQRCTCDRSESKPATKTSGAFAAMFGRGGGKR